VKVELDAYYLQHQSFLLDMRILLMTFFKVLRRDGITH
jgi:O-antigen biosynthesis protein WbqP